MLPLSGIRIVDMTRVLAGPYCTMLLADLGAEVIKIEKPGVGDDTRSWGPPFIPKKDGRKESVYFLSINRNKKSITLDVKKPESIEILCKLVEKSDVFVENYLPGKLAKMGLGYEALNSINPGLVYCSISGFGQTGPYSARGGYDVVASAMFGLMNITGYPDGDPAKPGVALTDISTGLYCHGAIMAALLQKMKTGLGQKIDASLLNTQVAVLSHITANYLTANVEPKRHGTAHGSIVPYQAFKSKDDKYLIIGAGNNKQFRILVKLLGFNDDLADNPKFSTNNARVENRVELIGLIQNRFSEKILSDWLQIFDGTDIPYGPINNMESVFNDPQVIHNNIVQTIDNTDNFQTPIRVAGPAVNFSSFRNSQTLRCPPPSLGQHTISVLKDLLKYTDKQIENFKNKNII